MTDTTKPSPKPDAQLFSPCRWYSRETLRARLGYWSLLGSALAGFAAWYYFHILQFWWSFDDAHLVAFAQGNRAADYLFDPEQYRTFHDVHLAPWNILVYEINLSLFGPLPEKFFAHHLLSLSLVAVAGFVFLRLWVSTAWAVTGTLLFIVSPPTAVVASQLMDGHYLEGLLFTVLSSILYVAAVRRNAIGLAILGGSLYFMATASKEIFVPLVLLLPCLPEGKLIRRARCLLPYVVVAVFYVVWRQIYIEDSVGTWIEQVSLGQLLRFPWQLAVNLTGSGTGAVVAAVVAASIPACAAILHPPIRLLMLVTIACLIGPLLPVSTILVPARFHLYAAWCMFGAFAVSCAFLTGRSRAWKIAVATALCILCPLLFAQSQKFVGNTIHENARFAAVGKFVMHQPAGHTLFLPGKKWVASDVAKLRSTLGKGVAPGIVYDYRQLGTALPPRVWRYDSKSNQFEDISDRLEETVQSFARHVEERPLSLKLEHTPAGVRWEFGPYTDQKYSVILLSADGAFVDVVPSGIYRARLGPMNFVLRYISRDGWVTYSDELQWQGTKGELLRWTRPSPE